MKLNSKLWRFQAFDATPKRYCRVLGPTRAYDYYFSLYVSGEIWLSRTFDDPAA